MSLLFIIACNSDGNINPSEHLDKDAELTFMLEDLGGSLAHYTLPSLYSEIPQDPKNPLTRTKVELGKLLFHETALGIKPEFPETINTYSCASCHHAAAGFQANVPQGIGDGGLGFGLAGEGRIFNPLCSKELMDVQPIRTPSALNIAFQTNVLWNGQFGGTALNEGTEAQWKEDTPLAVNKLGFEGTETQAIAGLDVHRFGLSIDEEFISSTAYKELFDLAFFNIPEDERYTLVNAGLAIATYERTLLATESPFQRWLKGEKSAMTENQKSGAVIFFKHGCGKCHDGPALNSMEFHALGMKDLVDNSVSINTAITDNVNLGRGGFTKVDADNYKFKVPQLYNLKDSPFLGHGSSFSSVEEVIRYKNNALAENERVPEDALSEDFIPLDLNELQIRLLTDFIENALYDPNLERYNPTSLPSGNCFPNNDVLSRVDLGCI